MTQTIDPVKIKAAAEHLEWVLKQYPDSEDVKDLLQALQPLIEDAKSGEVLNPIQRIPCEYKFSDGAYQCFIDPNVENAYVIFGREMRGGLTEKEEEILSIMKETRDATVEGCANP